MDTKWTWIFEDNLHRIGIKKTAVCIFCHENDDMTEHTFINRNDTWRTLENTIIPGTWLKPCCKAKWNGKQTLSCERQKRGKAKRKGTLPYNVD